MSFSGSSACLRGSLGSPYGLCQFEEEWPSESGQFQGLPGAFVFLLSLMNVPVEQTVSPLLGASCYFTSLLTSGSSTVS